MIESVRMIAVRIVVVCFFLLSGIHVFGKKVFADEVAHRNLLEKTVGFAELILEKLTWEEEHYTFSVYPVAGYSERTGLEVGVMPVLRFLPRNVVDSKYYRPTTLSPTAMVSTTGMYEGSLDVSYFSANKWFGGLKAQYLFMPDEFFGLGSGAKGDSSSVFDVVRFSFAGDVMKGVNETFFLGARLDVRHVDHQNVGGKLLNPTIVGYQGGWSVGVGPVVAVDTRDNVIYPKRGRYLRGYWLNYSGFLGSDFRFDVCNLDLRTFFPVGDKAGVIGFQYEMNLVFGEAPFFHLSALGGKRSVRGIGHPNRYLDENRWILQSEYRNHIWWRIGYALFAGGGNVYGKHSGGALSNVHSFVGGGLRFQAIPDEKLNFRIDFGVTSKGDKGLYFTIREAF